MIQKNPSWLQTKWPLFCIDPIHTDGGSMISGIISISITALTFYLGIGWTPRALPVMGLALAFNGLLKEKNRSRMRHLVIGMCMFGAVTNTIPTTIYVIHSLFPKTMVEEKPKPAIVRDGQLSRPTLQNVKTNRSIVRVE